MKYCAIICVLSVGCVTQEDLGEQSAEVNGNLFENPLGHSTTFSTAGAIDTGNAFFQDLGTNGRDCGHCHKAAEGWTISAASTRALFDATDGLDPIFRTNDGTTNPSADVSTVAARRAAYSMLLSRGTIRVGIGIPAGAEFELVAVDDPYGHASAAELSLFRRPLPSANLTLIAQVMWDGRVPGVTINAALSDQANGATLGHAAAAEPLDQATRDSIVAFEAGLFTAQRDVDGIGRLDRDGGHGGPEALANQAFVAGRFNLYDAWATSSDAQHRAVFRGQELFNTPQGGKTCRGCHSAENIGTNRNGTFFNINTSAGARRAADQPLYTIRNLTTGELIETTDPGRALITGKWSDVNRFKVPSLRSLASRAPYFHGGSANTLTDVVKFYESSLGFVFTPAQEADLVAFLSAL